MSDSIVEIINTTLNETELPDRGTSYDLITTDANTSYVIKDVKVETFSSDIDAKINNFSVANFAENLSGSEVLDVSSTLSLQGKDWPIFVGGIWWGNYNTADNSSIEVSTTTIPSFQETIQTDYVSDELDNLTGLGFSGFESSTTYLIRSFVLSSDKTKLFQLYTDANSRPKLRYWATPGSTFTDLIPGTYSPVWYLPHKESIYYRNGDELNAINVETGNITTIGSGLMSFGNYSSWSSYPRWTSNGDWLFYIKQAGYANTNVSRIHATNVTTEVTLEFTNCSPIALHSVGTKIGVSYDQKEDSYYVYRNAANTSYDLVQDKLPLTKLEMDAYTSNASIATESKRETKNDVTNTLGINYNQYYDVFTGHPTNGNKFYHFINQYTLEELDFNEVTREVFYTKDSAIADTFCFLTTYRFNAAQSTEVLGTDPSSIKLRITGVKTTP